MGAVWVDGTRAWVYQAAATARRATGGEPPSA